MKSLIINVQEPVSLINQSNNHNIQQQQRDEEYVQPVATKISILPWWISVYRLLLNRYNWFEVIIPIDFCCNPIIASSISISNYNNGDNNYNNNNETTTTTDNDGKITTNNNINNNNGKRMKETITKRYSTTMV